MSTTSDSDDEVEARKALLQQFRARKHAQAKDAAQPAELSPAAADEGGPPLCVQIGWPRDYVAHTGLWADCHRRGWDVVGTDRRPMPDPAAGAGDGDAAEAERRQGGQPDAARWRTEVRAFSRATRFVGLTVHAARAEGNEGWVRFTAHLEQGGRDASFEEHSHFLREGDRWLYVAAVP